MYGEDGGKIYVSFGPAATQEMPLEWAEHMLTELLEKHPPVFRKLIAEAATTNGNGHGRA